MDRFAERLNELIVDTFTSISKMEQQTIRRFTKINLSLSEIHLIEAAAKGGETGRTISDLAAELEITLPSVTVAINKLIKKGYAQKFKSEADGRVVFVKLTPKGRKVNSGHEYFHRNLTRNLSTQLTEEEKRVMIKGISKLKEYIDGRNEILQEKLEAKGIK